jgi:drug/metabolite transporter (DMT)-like permease
MLAIALGLGSSLCWGFSDFFGGLQSRARPVSAVIFVSQSLGLAAVAIYVAISGVAAPSLSDLWPAAAGGAAGVIALAAFYHALSIGTMSVVAPISATGAAVPVVVGLIDGEKPAPLQLVGMALALLGVILASREMQSDAAARRNLRLSVGLALVAALGFGSFFVGIKVSSEVSVPWAMLAGRGADIPLVVVAALAFRLPLSAERRALPALFAIGVLDLGANGLYALATTHGLLSVVAVLAALYPAVTVILARVMLSERVQRVQEAGIFAVLAGVALIAAG